MVEKGFETLSAPLVKVLQGLIETKARRPIDVARLIEACKDDEGKEQILFLIAYNNIPWDLKLVFAKICLDIEFHANKEDLQQLQILGWIDEEINMDPTVKENLRAIAQWRILSK